MLILFSSSYAQAITIGFDPVLQDVPVGTPVDVEVTISGLGDFMPDSLGAFDLNINFDPTILSFNSATFGDSMLGDQLDLFGFGFNPMGDLPGVGVVNIFEVSLNLPWDLEDFQAGSFTLATLTFDTLALGTSPLGLSINALSDAWGNPLTADVSSGSINVVPEPGAFLLIGSGLVGLAGLRKKLKVKNL